MWDAGYDMVVGMVGVCMYEKMGYKVSWDGLDSGKGDVHGVESARSFVHSHAFLKTAVRRMLGRRSDIIYQRSCSRSMLLTL